jgi:hypothetical protein
MNPKESSAKKTSVSLMDESKEAQSELQKDHIVAIAGLRHGTYYLSRFAVWCKQRRSRDRTRSSSLSVATMQPKHPQFVLVQLEQWRQNGQESAQDGA